MDPNDIAEDLMVPRTTTIYPEEIFNLTHQNSTSNGTRSDLNYYYFYDWIQFTVMWVLFVLIVVLNSSVIAALLCTNARKSRMNFFIMQLAIADLFVGLIMVFVDIIQRITIAWYAGEFMCKLVRFLQAVTMYASTYVLVALSIDRCDAITNPMNFSGSWNRARCLILAAWFISFIFSIPLLIFYEVKEIQGQMQCWIDLGSPRRWQIWMTLVSFMIFVLPAVTIAACYAVIVLTIWTKSKAVVMSPTVNSRRTKTMRNGQMECDPDSRRASSRGLIPRAKIKSVKMTFVIVFVFILCWSPYIVFDLLQVYDQLPHTQTTLAIATLIQSLAPLNSAANPLICCMFSPHIYASLRAWSLSILQRTRSSAACFLLISTPALGETETDTETLAIATLIQSLAPLNSAANPLICCMFSPHIYASLRRVPPYRWLWWGRRRRRTGRGTLRSRSESTANSDLLSSTHAKRSHSVATVLNRTQSNSVSSKPDPRKTQLLVLISSRD
ncbi:7 transmembrane receptor (rhodopsin family) domain-containing protein [Phthorimaea operculella]|nr:7 transmembrane receptor (rhodopsin family) domain-containing protein [Phthorimaea operculella]